jgi:hypothetical protein
MDSIRLPTECVVVAAPIRPRTSPTARAGSPASTWPVDSRRRRIAAIPVHGIGRGEQAAVAFRAEHFADQRNVSRQRVEGIGRHDRALQVTNAVADIHAPSLSDDTSRQACSGCSSDTRRGRTFVTPESAFLPPMRRPAMACPSESLSARVPRADCGRLARHNRRKFWAGEGGRPSDSA